jgi:DNA-binding NarL/FixJ family response regulator
VRGRRKRAFHHYDKSACVVVCRQSPIGAELHQRWAKESQKEQGLDLMRQGKKDAEIAVTLSVGLSTVRRWRKTCSTLVLYCFALRGGNA